MLAMHRAARLNRQATRRRARSGSGAAADMDVGARWRRAVSVVDVLEREPDTVIEDELAPRPASAKPPRRHSDRRCVSAIAALLSLIPGFLQGAWKSVCARTRSEQQTPTGTPRPATIPADRTRLSILAGAAFVGILVGSRVVLGEIDLNRLMPGATTSDGRPVIVVENGRLMNSGGAPALNLEVTRPRYRLVGTLAPGQGIEIPAPDFAVQFEWNEGNHVKRATRTFKVGGTSVSGNARVAGATHAIAAAAQSGAFDDALVPSGITATYEPATHLLTVVARKPVEVRVDGFLLRPIARTDENGAQYRYVQANVLVLGQDLKQGDTVTFEVVFTKPQDYYSIPIYVREPGKPPAYFTVSVATQAAS